MTDKEIQVLADKVNSLTYSERDKFYKSISESVRTYLSYLFDWDCNREMISNCFGNLPDDILDDVTSYATDKQSFADQVIALAEIRLKHIMEKK